MKVISKRVFEVTVVAPENANEDQELKKIIREIRDKPIAPKSEWTLIDNSKSP